MERREFLKATSAAADDADRHRVRRFVDPTRDLHTSRPAGGRASGESRILLETRLERVNPGFEASRVLTVALELDEARHPTPESSAVFFERLVERARSIPRVEHAAAGDSLPLKPFSTMMLGLEAQGQPRAPEGRGPDFAVCAVTPNYFRTMGITLVRGRPFGADDRTAPRPSPS